MRLSSLFLLKHGIVRVHDQHDLGDDEDEDKDQPADWWMAVARSTRGEFRNWLRRFSGTHFESEYPDISAEKPRKPIPRFHSTDWALDNVTNL